MLPATGPSYKSAPGGEPVDATGLRLRTDQDCSLFVPVKRAQQDVITTDCRRTQPRPWLKCVHWIINTGVHPKATTTTLRVARDLARRMDYRRGLVLYDLQGTARRLSLSIATVKRHVGVLREAGALVWLVHGSKRNLHVPGRKYTATATVYGAVIPPMYDQALGHIVVGTGYEARVAGYSPQGREHAIAIAVAQQRLHTARKKQHRARTRLRRGGDEPHSRTRPRSRPVLRDGGTEKATRKRANRPPRPTILGKRVTARDYALSHTIARSVRGRHTWLRSSKVSQLSWVLLDKVAEGLTEQEIDVWLREISPSLTVRWDWNPNRPHSYIAAQLRLESTLSGAAEDAGCPVPQTKPNTDFLNAAARLREVAPASSPREDTVSGEELADLRGAALAAYLRGDVDLVSAAVQGLGLQGAEQLYGTQLVHRALDLARGRRIDFAAARGAA